MPIPKTIQKISGAVANEITEMLKAGEDKTTPLAWRSSASTSRRARAQPDDRRRPPSRRRSSLGSRRAQNSAKPSTADHPLRGLPARA